MSTLALTQCWYTREHSPAHRPRDRVDGAYYAHCRHCRRPIFSIDGRAWHIDGGFNVDALGDAANAFLSVDDPADGITLARIAIPPSASDADIAALIEGTRRAYGIGEAGVTLILRDHRHVNRRAPPKRGRKTAAGLME